MNFSKEVKESFTHKMLADSRCYWFVYYCLKKIGMRGRISTII